MDKLPLVRLLDLLAQQVDVDVDDVRERTGSLLPDVAHDHVACDRRVLVPEEVSEELILASRQIQLDAATDDSSREEIHLEVIGTEEELPPGEVATEEGT